MSRHRWSHYLVVAAGYLFGAVALRAGLPEEIPPRWSVGHSTFWLGAPMVAFLLPTFITITDIFLRRLYMRDPEADRSSSNSVDTYDAIMLRMVFFVLGVHAMVLLRLLGLLDGHAWASRVVPLMLGFTMIAVGNLLPKTRPNLAIGIRTRRTLSDREVWSRIHRSTGYLLVTLGAILIVSAIAVPTRIGPLMILLVGPAAIVAVPLIVWRTKGGHT